MHRPHAAMHDREIDQIIATRQPLRGEVPFNGAFGRRHYDYLLVPVIGASGVISRCTLRSEAMIAGLVRRCSDP